MLNIHFRVCLLLFLSPTCLFNLVCNNIFVLAESMGIGKVQHGSCML